MKTCYSSGDGTAHLVRGREQRGSLAFRVKGSRGSTSRPPARMLIAGFVLAVSVGCVGAPAGAREPNQLEAQAIDELIRTWPHADDMTLCAEERGRLRVYVARTDADMVERTSFCGPGHCGDNWEGRGGPCPNGCASGATSRYADGVWPFAFVEHRWPLLVLWHGVDRRKITAHEAAHWLMLCTRRIYDRAHADPLVWPAASRAGHGNLTGDN